MRLIDADAFVEAIKKDLRKHPEDDLIYPVMEWFIENIKGRPTIEQPQWISVEERLPESNTAAFGVACLAETKHTEVITLNCIRRMKNESCNDKHSP